MATTETYTTRGSVRGGCGHVHRSLEAAVRCFRRDYSACQRRGGYSDRHVVPVPERPLAEHEAELIDHLEGR